MSFIRKAEFDYLIVSTNLISDPKNLPKIILQIGGVTGYSFWVDEKKKYFKLSYLNEFVSGEDISASFSINNNRIKIDGSRVTPTSNKTLKVSIKIVRDKKTGEGKFEVKQVEPTAEDLEILKGL
jgi:hypothetical protein